MKALLVSILVAVASRPTLGSDAAISHPLLNNGDLVIMAESNILAETLKINRALKNKTAPPEGYKKSQLAYMRKVDWPEIDPHFLFHKCILTSENLNAALTPVLSDATEALLEHVKTFDAAKEDFPKPVWRLVANICRHAEQNFTSRLKEASVFQKPLNFDDDLTGHLSRIVFSPTEYERATTPSEFINYMSVIATSGVMVGMVLDMTTTGFAKFIIDPNVLANNTLFVMGQNSSTRAAMRAIGHDVIIKDEIAHIDLNVDEIKLNEHIKESGY